MLEASINGKFTKEFKQNYEVFSKRRKSDARIWLAKEKISLITIAHRLNRSYFTITDEVRKVGGDYLAEIAQKMTRENLKRRGSKND